MTLLTSTASAAKSATPRARGGRTGLIDHEPTSLNYRWLAHLVPLLTCHCVVLMIDLMTK
jgi:hypothetical protein